VAAVAERRIDQRTWDFCVTRNSPRSEERVFGGWSSAHMKDERQWRPLWVDRPHLGSAGPLLWPAGSCGAQVSWVRCPTNSKVRGLRAYNCLYFNQLWLSLSIKNYFIGSSWWFYLDSYLDGECCCPFYAYIVHSPHSAWSVSSEYLKDSFSEQNTKWST
jgi:hypothetical protein